MTDDTAREAAALISTLIGEIMEDVSAEALDMRRLEGPRLPTMRLPCEPL